MDFLQPATWEEALEAKAAVRDAVPIAGGTDVMVGINFGRLRPSLLLDLTRVPELQQWADDDGAVRLGAGVPYARVISELGDRLPGLAMAARTIGSPQIRNRGTVGGNLATASPAGDAHPALLAAGAEVEVASVRGTRRIPVTEFYRGVKRSALADDELIAAVRVVPPSGPQQYSKIGTRNAMVIAVAAFGLALHPDRRAVGTGMDRPRPRRVARPRPRSSSPASSTACGTPAPSSRPPPPPASASWSPKRPHRSTTSAAPPATASTRSR